MTIATTASPEMMFASLLGVGLVVGMTHQPSHYGNTASDEISSLGGWASFIQDFIFGGVVLAVQYRAIEGINTMGGLILAPVRAMGDGLVTLVESTIGNVVSVLDAGTAATVLSFTDGAAAMLGPLAQPTAVGIAMLSVGIFILAVNRLSFSPLSFLQSLRN